MYGTPRVRKVVGQAGPGSKGTDRTEDGAEAVVRIALSEGMILGEGSRSLFVVPEGDHHGAPQPRWSFAGERNGDCGVEPSETGDLRGSWSVPEGAKRARCSEVGDVDGCDHRPVPPRPKHAAPGAAVPWHPRAHECHPGRANAVPRNRITGLIDLCHLKVRQHPRRIVVRSKADRPRHPSVMSLDRDSAPPGCEGPRRASEGARVRSQALLHSSPEDLAVTERPDGPADG